MTRLERLMAWLCALAIASIIGYITVGIRQKQIECEQSQGVLLRTVHGLVCVYEKTGGAK